MRGVKEKRQFSDILCLRNDLVHINLKICPFSSKRQPTLALLIEFTLPVFLEDKSVACFGHVTSL